MNSKAISRFFHKFTKIPGVRKFLGPIYHKFLLDPIRRKEIIIFQNNALAVLTEFDSVLRELDIPYCLMWGSLIGAVREKGFIKHDFDIDVAIWKNDYREELIKALNNKGFTLKDRLSVDNGVSAMEETVEKDGVMIDIFYLYKDETGQSYTCVFDYIDDCVTWEDCLKKYDNARIFRYYLNFPQKFIYTKFESISLPIPENYDEILSKTYGPNYMIPDKKWNRDPEVKQKAQWHNKKVDIYIG